MYVAKNLRYLRKQRNLSQEQVAEAFGYDNFTTVQKWETAKSEPPFKVAVALADFFNVKIDDLVKVDLERAAMFPAPAAPGNLTPEEIELVEGYRQIGSETRAGVLGMIRGALSSKDINPISRPSTSSQMSA